MKRRDRMRNRSPRRGLSADDRAQFARERQALVGKLLSQDGFEGALVVEHIHGSQYLVRLADGREVYMSHKKQRHEMTAVTAAGWRLWDLGSSER